MYTKNFPALLISGGLRWRGKVISYSFMNKVPSYYSANAEERRNFVPFNSYQRNSTRKVLKMYSEITGLTFREVSDSGRGGTIRFGTANIIAGAAHAYYPSTSRTGGDVWLGNNHSSNFTMTKGSYGLETLIHEVGHALGLKHPGNYNAGGGGSPGPYLFKSLDHRQYSVMSYNSHRGSDIEPHTPMLLDIAALQHLYGANYKTRRGNNVYSWSSRKAFVQTIWDGGGKDTINASNQSLPTKINLNPGSFSSIGRYDDGSRRRANNNLAIAKKVRIENAIGGSGNDRIIGNRARNYLRGNSGNDTLSGGAGNDVLTGNRGNDRLSGGANRDRLLGGTGSDRLSGDSGNDRLLGNNGDDILLGGSGGDRLVGNAGDDTLLGGSGSDRLVGFSSAKGREYDVLTGGRGKDIFVLGESFGTVYRGRGYGRITDFNHRADTIQLKGSSSQYSLRRGNWFGDSALDTAILRGNDYIGVVEDTTNLRLNRDFNFV